MFKPTKKCIIKPNMKPTVESQIAIIKPNTENRSN